MRALFCISVLLVIWHVTYAAPRTDIEIKKLLAEGRTMEEMDEIRTLLRMLNEATIQEVSKMDREKRDVLEREDNIGRRKPHKNIVEINKELLPYLFQGDINLTREQLLDILNIRLQKGIRSSSV
ncbi:hypothetical protein Y032_0116g625 [Ancylostoma ceylanicum]|uniref:Uncharacterized protein n=1 Tax=Ancylostoma ceylanicum TaxID=53326 RepID=A0A016TCM6_9BILA|nr:hypothetical protein Y032_0116g625 [Ancylostoma ceylanicum]